MSRRLRSWLYSRVANAVYIAAFSTILTASLGCTRPDVAPPATRQLNILAWAGYDEPALVGAFEQQFDVEVRVKTFFGGDGMLTLLTQSPNTYDIVVADEDYLQRLYDAKLITPLDPAALDFRDYLEPFKAPEFTRIGGDLYGIVVEFGTSSLTYNTSSLSQEDVSSYEILWDPRTKGRVGIWDWYLPTMGNISILLGHESPYDLTDEQFAELKAKLSELRPQVTAFLGSPTEMASALVAEEVWIIPGAGEWIASLLAQEGHPIDWAIPEEGALLWVNTLAIPKGAPNQDVAVEYLRWMQSSEAQALLSQKIAYNANVPNVAAYDMLTASQRKILKYESPAETELLLRRLYDRKLPIRPDETEWQRAWEEFKAAR